MKKSKFIESQIVFALHQTETGTKVGEVIRSRAHRKNETVKLNSVRAAVEHLFAWMKTKANLAAMRAKNQIRNRLRYVFACIR